MPDRTPPPASERLAIPAALTDAPQSHGMTVPYITLAHRDRSYRPVWGRIDARRLHKILNRRLCQVCGAPLTDQVVVFLRPDDYALGVASEPGLHPACAEYTTQACPVLAGRIHRYNPHPEVRSTECDDPRCDCRHWSRTPPREPQPPRPIEAWYAIHLPLTEYRVLTIAATDTNPEITGIDVHTPSLLHRVRRIRASADPASGTDPLKLLLITSAMFGGERP